MFVFFFFLHLRQRLLCIQACPVCLMDDFGVELSYVLVESDEIVLLCLKAAAWVCSTKVERSSCIYSFVCICIYIDERVG